MNNKELFKKYFNPWVGLTFRGDSNGNGRMREYADSENCGLWLALMIIIDPLNKDFYMDYLLSVFRKRQAYKKKDHLSALGLGVNGLYDRGRKESFRGYSCNEVKHARTNSRDEMMAAASDSDLAKEIVGMGFRSFWRYPNHWVESLNSFEGFFTKKYWRNFQFQFWDQCYYMLRSNSKFHNILGWLLFPIYYIMQFTTTLQYEVTRHGNEKQLKNSGDQLWVLRDYWLQEYAVYRFLRVPLVWLYKRKWKHPRMKAKWVGDNLYKTIIYNFHKSPWPGDREGYMRNHDFPITQVLEKEL